MKIEIDIPDHFISDENSYISISGDNFEYCRFDKFYRGLQCNHKKDSKEYYVLQSELDIISDGVINLITNKLL
jgi:hypothetical protein|nr:MAG TPA: hypothetical protein [Caudoviricetes sp.]